MRPMCPTGYFFVELTGEFAQWNPYQNEVEKNCKSYRLRYAGLKFFCAAARDDVFSYRIFCGAFPENDGNRP